VTILLYYIVDHLVSFPVSVFDLGKQSMRRSELKCSTKHLTTKEGNTSLQYQG